MANCSPCNQSRCDARASGLDHYSLQLECLTVANGVLALQVQLKTTDGIAAGGPVLVGTDVDEVIADAEHRGWTDVGVHRLDSREDFFQELSLGTRTRIVLDVGDEVVVRAVAG